MVKLHVFYTTLISVGLAQCEIQSNFNGSNTFRTMKISSRQGKFEPVRVDYSARSGRIIGIIFRFSLT